MKDCLICLMCMAINSEGTVLCDISVACFRSPSDIWPRCQKEGLWSRLGKKGLGLISDGLMNASVSVSESRVLVLVSVSNC